MMSQNPSLDVSVVKCCQWLLFGETHFWKIFGVAGDAMHVSHAFYHLRKLYGSAKVAAFKNVIKYFLKTSLLFNLLHWEEEADWHHVACWTLFLGTQEFVDKDYGALGVWIWFSCVESRLWVWQENNRLHQGLSTCFPPRCYSNLSLFLHKESIHSGVKVNRHKHHRNGLGFKILMDLVEFAASCWLSKGLACTKCKSMNSEIAHPNSKHFIFWCLVSLHMEVNSMFSHEGYVIQSKSILTHWVSKSKSRVNMQNKSVLKI
jgi:hypothetical protein